MSAADSRGSSERSDSRSSNTKGRKLIRLSRNKSNPTKFPSAALAAEQHRRAPSGITPNYFYNIEAEDDDVSVAPVKASATLTALPAPIGADRYSAAHASRTISRPFDFMHVKHTQRHDLGDLNRLSHYELASEFGAATAQRPPTRDLNGIQAQDLYQDGYTSDVTSTHPKKHSHAESVRAVIPPRPRRSDEFIADSGVVQPEGTPRLRHVRSAETIGEIPSISQITPSHLPQHFREAPRRDWVDGPAIKNLGGLGARQPTGAPQLPPNDSKRASTDPRWSVFASAGFASTNSTAQQTQLYHGQPDQQPSALQQYLDDALITPSYGKELERVPEEPEESRSQRTSKALPSAEILPPSSPGLHRPSLPIRSPSRSFQVGGPIEAVRRAHPSRANSNASDTLAGFIHRPLGSRKSTSSFLSTATSRSRGTRRGGTDSMAWEDEIDFAYEHHMEAHCDLDWANTSKRETGTSVETVPELDHSNTSSARSTQDGSLLPPSSMTIDVLATVTEQLSASDMSGSEDQFTRRKPTVGEVNRETFLYDDGRPDLGLIPTTPSDLDDSKLTMSATTVSGSEVSTPAETGVFKFPIRRQLDSETATTPIREQDDMYAEVLASYEKATRPSLDAVAEASSADEGETPSLKEAVFDVAESRPFHRASARASLLHHGAMHQKSASTGTVTDFAVAALKARMQEVNQAEDDGVTPRQSSRLSANNLRLHTMVSTLRAEASAPTTPGSELTDEPLSLASSQASLPPKDHQSSMAPSSTASDDMYQSMLPPAPMEAPPIPQRSRSRLNRPSALVTPLTTPSTEDPNPMVPTHRKLHSYSSANYPMSAPPSHVAFFSPRTDSLAALTPVNTNASEPSLAPVNTNTSDMSLPQVSPIDSKELPPLPSPPIVHSRSFRRRQSETSNAIGMASLAVPIATLRPSSKGSVVTTVHNPAPEKAQMKHQSAKPQRPAHRKADSRSSVSVNKHKTVRHYCYGFDVIDDLPKKPAPPSNKDQISRPFTQVNLPSQEILALGGEQNRPIPSGADFVARQYSEMSSDQPAPTFITSTSSSANMPNHSKSMSFSLFPSTPAKPKSKIRNLSEASRLDKVLTVLQ